MNGESLSESAVSFDVVIPTVRLDPSYLCTLLNLPHPHNVTVRYYVVVDQPDSRIPDTLRDLFDRPGVTLLLNEHNCGAAESRNRGFLAGEGQFVLFLDDDVIPEPALLGEYHAAISCDARESPGYVGVTRFPPPVNRFTGGVCASDMLTFFDLAAHRPILEWGVTANLCVRRSCVVGVPFRPGFPRRGGGEDIDFCLRLRDAAGLPFRAVPTAVAHHPWWNDGARSYDRFYRWAYGDSRLPALHLCHRYLNFPTIPELCLVLLLLMPVFVMRGMVPAAGLFLVGAAVIEFLVDYLKLCLRRPGTNLLISVEATVIRLSNDLGRLASHVEQLRMRGVLERFDYFGTGESITYERIVSGTKFLAWLILACMLFA